ncbi:hypothetical protein [Virgisporangium aliadipatigenens]|uniref:hypothetical protein n=1 Tax=Virgisporangium aliadipatigenens TaxID=741659 RepID=UPI003570B816
MLGGAAAALVLLAGGTLYACTGEDPPTRNTSAAAAPSTDPAAPPAGSAAPPPSASAGPSASAAASASPAAPPLRAGNPDGKADVPAEARAVDTSRPSRVIGDGTPSSCTSEAVVAAVAAGGIITFRCGPDPVTITMKATAKVRNDHGPQVVLDGGGRVTLSGGGQRRILYMNTCDAAQVHTTSHCQDQDSPQLTLQNITFADGTSVNEAKNDGETEGGGAVFVRGGRIKVVNARFTKNRCDTNGPDLGGAGLRVLSQYQNKPVYVVNSTFEGGACSNGAAISSIGVSWVILNSVMRNNSAIGRGQNPAQAGTPGGGSGGAIYMDGNLITLRIAGSIIEDNKCNEGGAAIFFVSNDRTGTMAIESSTLRRNPRGTFETAGLPGIFFLGARPPAVSGSTLSR